MFLQGAGAQSVSNYYFGHQTVPNFSPGEKRESFPWRWRWQYAPLQILVCSDSYFLYEENLRLDYF